MSIQKAYNSWASSYDSNENKTRDLDKAVTVQTLEQFEFRKVLELGCGTGKNTEWLATRADHILGLDFSEEMLDKARQKIPQEKVEFRRQDLNLDWLVEENAFDLLTSSLVLEHIEKLDPIFTQGHSRLVDGGLFFICELHPYKQYQGSGARFETENGTEQLEVYTHHVSDYLSSAKRAGFELLELKEWQDENAENKPPRLISFVFRKP